MIEKDFDMEVFAYMQFFSHCWFLRTSLGPVLAHLASRHWLTTDPLGPLFGSHHCMGPLQEGNYRLLEW